MDCQENVWVGRMNEQFFPLSSASMADVPLSKAPNLNCSTGVAACSSPLVQVCAHLLYPICVCVCIQWDGFNVEKNFYCAIYVTNKADLHLYILFIGAWGAFPSGVCSSLVSSHCPCQRVDWIRPVTAS